MIIVWSAKGGSGATITACTLALRPLHGPSLLVDLDGDVPAALGVAEPSGPGVAEWLRSPTASGADLLRLAVMVNDDLCVVPRGGDIPADAPWSRLAEALTSPNHHRQVVVDAGTGAPPAALVAGARESLLVLRPCYLAIRRAVRLHAEPTGIIVVADRTHALGARDVAASVGAPVVAELPFDPAITRAVDSGMLATRLPRTLSAPLRKVC
jgi:MinD superfamily P-loop ATPase